MLLLILYIICSGKSPNSSVVDSFKWNDFTLSWDRIFGLPLNKPVQTVTE